MAHSARAPSLLFVLFAALAPLSVACGADGPGDPTPGGPNSSATSASTNGPATATAPTPDAPTNAPTTPTPTSTTTPAGTPTAAPTQPPHPAGCGGGPNGCPSVPGDPNTAQVSLTQLCGATCAVHLDETLTALQANPPTGDAAVTVAIGCGRAVVKYGDRHVAHQGHEDTFDLASGALVGRYDWSSTPDPKCHTGALQGGVVAAFCADAVACGVAAVDLSGETPVCGK